MSDTLSGTVSDDEVDYVDIPLVEEDSDDETNNVNNNSNNDNEDINENNTDLSINKKKRKLELLRSNRNDKKKTIKNTIINEIDLTNITNQYEYFIQYCSSNNITKQISNNDILDLDGKCPLDIVSSVELSGLKRSLKIGSFEAGSPVCIIICPSALRCTQVIANLSNKYKCRIAKLFAKHMKVEEQIDALKKSYPLAVGTPSRINRLIELGALSITQCTTIILDITPDIKKIHLLNSHETQKDVYSFIETSVLSELQHIKISLIKEVCIINNNHKKPSQSKKSSFKGRKGI